MVFMNAIGNSEIDALTAKPGRAPTDQITEIRYQFSRHATYSQPHTAYGGEGVEEGAINHTDRRNREF